LLLHATGISNNFKWPEIQGLEKLKGKVARKLIMILNSADAALSDTAIWPKNSRKERKNGSVAIIGSGASSIQTLANMQPFVKHIDVYVRTAIWFISIAGNNGAGEIYTEEQRNQFRADIKELVKHAKHLETEINAI
jgi:cation diffusion facilitator CzcD-associated flavoprotein CzcO